MIKIECVVRDLPLPPHTHDQFQEWIRFKLGDTCEMQDSNPLIDTELVTENVRILEWTPRRH